MLSLASLTVLSRAVLNEDWFDDYLEHTQASTCLSAAERFTCFTTVSYTHLTLPTKA